MGNPTSRRRSNCVRIIRASELDSNTAWTLASDLNVELGDGCIFAPNIPLNSCKRQVPMRIHDKSDRNHDHYHD
jgi:hypothetical protein